MEGYSVKIVNSSRNLTAKERVAMKNFDSAVSLDDLIPDDGTGVKEILKIVDFVECEVHNEKSDNKDYTKFILIAEDGQRYITGSQPLFDSFMAIYDEMNESEEGEEWSIAVYRRESNNFKGKSFLTCEIV